MLEEEKDNLDPVEEQDQEETLSEEDEGMDEEQEGETEEAEEGEEEGEGDEPDLAALKAENEKLRRERDNYKTGLLSHKAKSRPLPFSGEITKETKSKEEKEDTEDDIVSAKVKSVLGREAEQRAMRLVLDPDSKSYIKELENSEDAREIYQYLPKNSDRLTEDGVIRALRVATAAWKFDRGFTTKKPEKKNAKLVGTESSSTFSGGSLGQKKKKGERHFLKRHVAPSEWYK